MRRKLLSESIRKVSPARCPPVYVCVPDQPGPHPIGPHPIVDPHPIAPKPCTLYGTRCKAGQTKRFRKMRNGCSKPYCVGKPIRPHPFPLPAPCPKSVTTCPKGQERVLKDSPFETSDQRRESKKTMAWPRRGPQ